MLQSHSVSTFSSLLAATHSSSPGTAPSVLAIDNVLSVLPVMLRPFSVFEPHTPLEFPQRWQPSLQNLPRWWHPLYSPNLIPILARKGLLFPSLVKRGLLFPSLVKRGLLFPSLTQRLFQFMTSKPCLFPLLISVLCLLQPQNKAQCSLHPLTLVY